MNKTMIVISANSDIGYKICNEYKNDGWNIYGTYNTDTNVADLKDIGVELFKLDMSDSSAVRDVALKLKKSVGEWAVLINATGMQSPVGRFEKTNIDGWVSSVHVNFIEQIRITYYLLPSRVKNASIIFFAGGGTNNAVMNYSAYTLSKVSLIKACEILDHEIDDAAFTIIGPGWVKTRIHNETLKAGQEMAGDNYQTTLDHIKNNVFTPMEDVVNSVRWVINQSKNIVGGRNFSTVYDKWGSDDLVTMLGNDENMYKLRRHGNNYLVDKNRTN